MNRPFPTTDPSWDLDSIFEGGVESKAFGREVEALREGVGELQDRFEAIEAPSAGALDEAQRQQWRTLFDRYFDLRSRSSEARTFAFGMACTHTDQPEATRLPSRLDDVLTELRQIRVLLVGKFQGISEAAFEGFLEDDRFSDMTLWLRELRRDAQKAMPPELEALAVDLGEDGFHAWNTLYSEVSGRLDVSVETDDGIQSYSVGQAKNLLDSPDRSLRRAAHEGLNKAWGEVAPICASALHSIRGTEQTLYRRRGDDCLTKALEANRVQRSTVEAMFEAARHFQPLLVRYLKAKARALGIEQLQWYDLHAPVGKDKSDISYVEAQQFIVDQVGRISPKIAEFCRHALAHQWVEAEDRSGKRQGGFCSSLPVSKEIRIFMTFGGTNSGVTTLAHELGHGYHGEVMKGLSMAERNVPMGLGETASTLLEAVVEQAAVEQAQASTRLALLDDRLGRAVVFLMNIPARFELEKKMHEVRAEERLHEDLLSELTAQIYGEAYGDGVASVDELGWASKLHFFMTHLPFYNFPYTFGYLFSRAVYAWAKEAGDGFVERIDDLLLDTGRMTSEEVAKKHLGVELDNPGFWREAAGSLEADVEKFESLVDR